jgi:hypothetical protein
MIADLILLRIGQVVRGPAVAFKAANRSHEIITPCSTKENGQTVLVNEIWHVVSLIHVAAITHDLPSLLGGQSLYTLVSRAHGGERIVTYRLTSSLSLDAGHKTEAFSDSHRCA